MKKSLIQALERTNIKLLEKIKFAMKPQIFRFEDKRMVENVCEKNLKLYSQSAKKLSEIYERCQQLTKNKFKLKRRYFKTILMASLENSYGNMTS